MYILFIGISPSQSQCNQGVSKFRHNKKIRKTILSVEDAKLQSMTKSELIEKLERQYYQNTIFHETERIANIGYYEWDFELDRLDSCSEGYAHIFNMSVDEVMLAESSWEARC